MRSSTKRIRVATLGWLVLALAATAVAQQPAARAPMASDQDRAPLFDAVSIKPSGPDEHSAWQPPHGGGIWSEQANSLAFIIYKAFDRGPGRIASMPDWARTSRYDIEVHMPPDTSIAQFALMLRALLADRFQMVSHEEMRPMDVVVLTAGAPGPGLKPANPACVPPPGVAPGTLGGVAGKPGSLEYAGCSVSMAAFTDFFNQGAVTPVVNESGLTGLYDIELTLTSPARVDDETMDDWATAAQLASKAAFQQQLGIGFDTTRTVKRPMPFLVIDHIAAPTAN